MSRMELPQNYIDLISQCQNYEEMMTLSLDYLGETLRALPDKKRIIIDELIEKAEEVNDLIALAELNYYRAWVDMDSDDYKSAIVYLDKSKDYFIGLNSKKGILRIHCTLGFYYTSMGNPQAGFQNYKIALDIANDLNDEEAMAPIYANMAEDFLTLKRYDDALVYFEKALSLCPYGDNQCIIIEGIGNIYREMGNHEMALQYLYRALAIAEERNVELLKTGVLVNIALTYKGLGDLERATEILIVTIEQSERLGLSRIEAGSTLHLGKIYKGQKEPQAALKYLKRSLVVSTDINLISLKIESLYNIAETLGELNEWQEAFEYFNRYTEEYQKYNCLEAAKEIDRLKINEANREAESYKNRYNQMTIINQIGRQITSTLDIKEIVKTIYDKLNNLMEAAVFGLGFNDN